MDELLKALRAEFPGLEWQSFSPFGAGYPPTGYRADVPGASLEAGEVDGNGGITMLFSGGPEVIGQAWQRSRERALCLARFHRKLQLAATVVAAAVEVADGK